MSTPEIFTQIADEGFEALVSKGIHVLLFPMRRVDGKIQVDTSKNLLYGYPVGGFNTSGETVEQEEFHDQLRGGANKMFIAGTTDPGDITFNAYFDPNMGKPKIEGVVNSMVVTPQFALALARKKSDSMLEGFLCGGVNYLGGYDIKGDLGKKIGSSLKFKFTGTVLYGYEKVGDIAMSLYRAGATGVQGASADLGLMQMIANSAEETEDS